LKLKLKKAALKATASCLSRFGDKLLKGQINQTISVLNDRLNNEVTRETSLACFATLGESPLSIDISSVINKVVESATSLLKQAKSSLREQAALTLTSIISKSKSIGKCNEKLLLALIQQCVDYINDTDLHLCSLILILIREIITKSSVFGKNILSCIIKCIFPCCYKFVQSPLLQGTALDSIKSLFSVFCSITQGKLLSFNEIKNELIKAAAPKLTRSSYSAIAQCISVIVLSTGCDKKSVSDIINLIKKQNEAECVVALLTIGELGTSGQDLSVIDNNLEGKIFAAFSVDSESVKYAASYALGNIAVGNMKKYVPALMQMIKSYQDRQYLLLNSLKEIITYYSSNSKLSALLLPFSSNITPLLLSNSASNDEGVRSMIAECLGKFALIDNKIFDEIEKLLDAKDSNTRETMCQSIKYGLTNIPQTTINNF